MFLHKVGLAPSPLCIFCERESESIEHLLLKCDYSNKFWQDLINWFNGIGIEVTNLSEVDKIFGIWNRETDFHLLNHLLILAKQHIYFCRNKGCPPSLKIYLAKVASIHQIEAIISQSNGKQSLQQVTILNLVALRVFNNYCQQNIVYFVCVCVFSCCYVMLINIVFFFCIEFCFLFDSFLHVCISVVTYVPCKYHYKYQ